MEEHFTQFLRRLPELVEGADEIPLFGNAPPFDFSRLSALLSGRFEIKDFSIHPSEQAWCSPEEIDAWLGSQHFSASIHLNPLQAPLYFALPKADKNKLAAVMMHGKAKSQISEPLKTGFCRFLVLEALAAASGLEPIDKLSPSLGESGEIPREMAFCVDVEITLNETSCWGRLILPASFRKAWVEHFTALRPEYASSRITRSTELVLGLQCGSTILTQPEWEELEPGDFVLLDKGDYDPVQKSALAVLKIGNISLFQAKITQNQIELLDYALTQEEPMDTNEPLPSAEEESVTIKDVPLSVSVELARLKITLDQLMHLNPGNMLTLPVHPDQGVVLTVNGKKVGRAELLYLGESLGIRILEIG